MYLEVGVASCNAAVVDSSARGRDVGSTAVEERLEGTSAEVINNKQSVIIMNTHFFSIATLVIIYDAVYEAFFRIKP